MPPLLQPVAHSLMQSAEEVRHHMRNATHDELWTAPGRTTSAGYHLQHAAGSLDRLFTYARGEQLSRAQLDLLARETHTGDGTVDELVIAFIAAVERSLAQLRATDDTRLLDAREVGRGRLPSTTLGLLVHAAEHTQRHVGQLVTILRIVQGRQDS
ncbi:MAG: DinB family protein [Gemmatimonadaceae bacterium]